MPFGEPKMPTPEELKAQQPAAARPEAGQVSAEQEGAQIEQLKQSLAELRIAFQNVEKPLYLSMVGGEFTVVESVDGSGTMPFEEMIKLRELINGIAQINVAIGENDAVLGNKEAGKFKMDTLLQQMLARTHEIHPDRLFNIMQAAIDSAEKK